MRHQVPFVGERKLIRAEDDQAQEKRVQGRVIDAVVGEKQSESSWEDVVPAGWDDKSLPPKVLRPEPARPSISLPGPSVPLKPRSKLITPGTSWKLSAKSASPFNVVANQAIFSTRSALDWVLINNGRCYRVNIRGCMDRSLRRDWARMLKDTGQTDVREFEFNLTGMPVLTLTGLGMLLLFKERKGSLRDEIRLCNCSRNVEQLLRWTGMDKYFLIQNPWHS